MNKKRMKKSQGGEHHLKEVSEEEANLFRTAVKNIQRLKQVNKVTVRKKPTIRKPRNDNFESDDFSPILTDHQTEENVPPGGELFFVRSGLSPKQVRNLRHGKIPIAATLDLHGFDAESARKALIEFIDLSYKKNKRCISIIHGKGHSETPVIKNKINNWLRQFETVLAFSTALPKHGGTGAVYVLLKSHRS